MKRIFVACFMTFLSVGTLAEPFPENIEESKLHQYIEQKQHDQLLQLALSASEPVAIQAYQWVEDNKRYEDMRWVALAGDHKNLRLRAAKLLSLCNSDEPCFSYLKELVRSVWHLDVFHIAAKALCRKNEEETLSYVLGSIPSLVEPHEHELLSRFVCSFTVKSLALEDLEAVYALVYRFTSSPYVSQDAPLDAIQQLAFLAQSTSDRLQALQEVSSCDPVLTTLLSQKDVKEKVQEPLLRFQKAVLKDLSEIVIREASLSTEKDKAQCFEEAGEERDWECEYVVPPPVGQTALDYLKWLTGAEETLYTIAIEASNPDFAKQALEAYKNLLQKETDKKIELLTQEM